MITTDQAAHPGSRGWTISEEAGIHVHRLAISYSNQMNRRQRIRAFLSFAFLASRIAAQLKADVIFATSTPLTAVLPALYASWRNKTPYVFEIRDVWPDVPVALGYLRNPLLRAAAYWLERTAYRRATRLVALAPGMGQRMIDCGVPANLITIIPNGCDTQVFEQVSADEIAKIRADAWLGDRPLILYAGTLGAIGGASYVVEVAAAALAIDPEVKFVMIGEGREEARIRARAAELGVLDRNLRMLPAMPKVEVAAWFRGSTITLALFSGPKVVWKDAVQNKFFDSLAAGKPMISNHDGWQNEIATSNDVGFSVPAKDATAAARMIIAAARDKAWLAGVAFRARDLAHGEFSRDAQAKVLIDVLTTAASVGRASRAKV